jgi:hypothetical protein
VVECTVAVMCSQRVSTPRCIQTARECIEGKQGPYPPQHPLRVTMLYPRPISRFDANRLRIRV